MIDFFENLPPYLQALVAVLLLGYSRGVLLLYLYLNP